MCEVEVRELKENCEDPVGDRIKTLNKESHHGTVLQLSKEG